MNWQWISNLKISRKLALLVLPPLLTSILFGGMYVSNEYRTQQQLQLVIELSNVAIINSALVHELQKERGMSAGYIGSKGQSFKDDLPVQRGQTDNQISRFKQFAQQDDFPIQLQSTYDQVTSSLLQLKTMRDKVSNLAVTVPEQVSYYTQMNTLLLSMVDEAANQSLDSELSMRLKAFAAYLQLKERAGIERAVLSTTFGHSEFAPGLFRKFVTLVAEQQTYAERFIAAAHTNNINLFKQAQQSSAMTDVQALREVAFAQDATAMLAQSPEEWFKTSTTRIAILTELEKQFGNDLIQLSQDKLAKASQHMYSTALLLLLALVFVIIMSLSVSAYLHRSLNVLHKQMLHAGTQYDLTTRLPHQSEDEFGQISIAFNQMMAEFEDIITQVRVNAVNLVNAVEKMNGYTRSMQIDVLQGSSEAEQVASAMTQMSATVHEIAANAVQASDASAKANLEAKSGESDVSKTGDAIQLLANEIADAAQAIGRLDVDVQSIVTILDVISSIAEQTNLLALNAAIEAARAGDQGRGFAVVADEVRTLAQRSQSSTEDIKSMTERLKSGATTAVKAMKRGQEQAQLSVEESKHAGSELKLIAEHVGVIDSMNEQIAASTHEQSAVAEEVNRNAMKITEIYHHTQEISQQLAELNDSLLNDANNMSQQVSKFTLSTS
ncbi:methyl-accepting chemotaxis protein [Shewanella ulleungensis]|uniref:Methyl-accepting chemotaxis protein n=1 Tax=Shewanella ulleungensis TaxID=2282699 RepID=A0ABQ2QQL8_9GAMM|nr:methyl-accepting chemotaxis protein [Shewanella ulleungensis]MCL1151600.1 methyl-accepting chemotaxis protein [Shewanella ulleungensis]GGP89837.1 methyl-accepting chemotaxis protein [Shewanella ulleungensis]